MFIFIEYPICSTCKRAKAWLDEHGVNYKPRDIVKENPTKEELADWIKRSKLPMKRFFNTSGLIYRERKIAEKIKTMTEDEQLELLASNGMLVKRPILIGDSEIQVGFKKENWELSL